MCKIVDFSHNNGHVDWSKAKDELEFAIIRVQYGANMEDRLHKENEAECNKYGIPFGQYAYGHYTSVSDSKNEAKVFLSRIDKSAKFLLLDVEKDTIATCGTKNLAEASQAFIDICRAAGYKTGFYVSHELYKKYGLDGIKADFLMLPRYGKDNGTPDQKPDYPCNLWQYTQNGKLAGVSGNVDLSMIVGNKDADWFKGVVKVQEVKPTSAPIWQGEELRKGQIGKITVLKDINLWQRDGEKLKFTGRVLHPNETFRVYSYDDKFGGQYGVGSSLYVTNMSGFLKYETPSKDLLQQANEFYGLN